MSACDTCLRRSHVIATLAGRIEALLQRPGDRVRQVLALPTDALLEALVRPEDRASTRAEIDAFEPDNARVISRGRALGQLCRHDPAYPADLRGLPEAPPVLWHTGPPERLTEFLSGPSVAVVGSRRPSAYGLEVAEELGRGLSTAGVTVVSGLAMGIDAAAHRGALRSRESRTIAVLGGGADVVYPRVNRSLYEPIAADGVVISESFPGRRPYRWTFPARNRIMAALTTMTVVVEASDPSGSLITAAFAAELGRGVAAVPGRVTSATAAGSNRLLRDGAAVIRDTADALDEIFGVGGAGRVRDTAEPELEPDEQAVLLALENGTDIGMLASETKLDPARVRVVIGTLEAQGLIRRSGIASYERRLG